MSNLASKGTVLVGDILLAGAKLDKAIRIRIGSGGVAVGTSFSSLGVSLPAQAVVYDVFLNVLTPSTGATKTLLFGTSASPSGFLNGLAAGSSGIVLPVVAAGTSGAGTYGSLLTTQTTGNAPVQKSYASDANASKLLGFTPNSSEWIAFSADLYLCVLDLTQ